MSIPGLPALPSAVAGLFAALPLLDADAPGLSSQPSVSQWGIFLGGQAVVLADNVLSIDYRQDFAISNYPVEQGAFSSYNKVQKPFEIRVRFSTGGSDADRQAFLTSIQAIIGDTNLYDVVTPNATYTNVNLVHQDYSRSSGKGLGLIIVDVGCEEVRSASLTTSNTATSTAPDAAPTPSQRVAGGVSQIDQPQSPSASPQVNGGNVQPQTPTPSQAATFNSDFAAAGGFMP